MSEIYFKNKKAYHNFELIENFEACVLLLGTEIKSIRCGKVSFNDSYCKFINDELFIINLHISEYKFAFKDLNHEPLRNRKLLLTKKELKKLKKNVEERGLTIVPTSLFINKKGWCKINVALARGKKTHDKREAIKIKNLKRDYSIKIK